MGDAIGQSLSLAIGVALSPIPIIAVTLLLVTAHGRVSGSAFVLGWVLGLAVIGAIVLTVAGPADAAGDEGPATWVHVLKLALGALLVPVAIRLESRVGYEEQVTTVGRDALHNAVTVGPLASAPWERVLTLLVFFEPLSRTKTSASLLRQVWRERLGDAGVRAK
jgi:Sap, sulfolipid-1-addressing protein